MIENLNPIKLKLSNYSLKPQYSSHNHPPLNQDSINNESISQHKPNSTIISHTPLATVFSLTPSEDMDEGIININSSTNKINKVEDNGGVNFNKINLMPNIFNTLPIWATKDDGDDIDGRNSSQLDHNDINQNQNKEG